MNRNLFVAAAFALALSGCASRPATRVEYSGLPSLENGWSRVYLSAGVMSGVKLWSVHQVGPVFINDQRVGSNAKDEHTIVDLHPGTYEVYCTPEEPEKNLTEKHQFTFVAGETRYLACDMEPKGAGMYFGLIGAIASEHLTKSYFQDRPIDANSKLVSYRKLPSAIMGVTPPIPSAPVAAINQTGKGIETAAATQSPAPVLPPDLDTHQQSTSETVLPVQSQANMALPVETSTARRLRELGVLRKQGLITESEYNTKRQAILSAM